MATRKKNLLQAANKARATAAKAREKQAVRELTKLKKLGVYTGNPKDGAKTSYGRSVARKFSDVLTGKAKVVKADVNTEIAYRGAGGRAAHGKIVVEAEKGERIYAEKKKNKQTGKMEYTGRLLAKRTAYGNTTRRQIIFQKVFDPAKLPKPPKGKDYRYQVHFEKTGVSAETDNPEELARIMAKYPQSYSKSEAVRTRFKKYWASRVYVTEIVPK